jgi:flagellar assembly protein FliH
MNSSSRPAAADAERHGATPGRNGGHAYSRFIPREELGHFAAWQPGTFGSAAPAAPAPAPAAAPAADPAADARAERERLAAARQAGYEDGYRDGLVALENFKQSFAAQTTAQVGALVAALQREFDALEAKLAEAVAATAVQIARQVVRNELATSPALVAKVAADAVGAMLLSARHITVHVHPQDQALVAQGAEEPIAARHARIVADPEIERGGVRVDSDLGSVDATIASRWQQAVGALGAAVRWNDDGGLA